ncbi:hypothetical protein GGI12_002614 [Dipsacomyces acuminosporus]|nr:hypothetical protein GGI12_002614 [Dipsacomyces acuminosporus]
MGSVANIADGLLARDATGGISVTGASSLVDAVSFVTHSPTIVSSNINASGTPTAVHTPAQQSHHHHQPQQQQQQQPPSQMHHQPHQQRSQRGTLSDLPINTHFCSSCKKRMPFDAFQRRQNGNLYNTCISCLTRTKQRKGQQARINAEASMANAASGAPNSSAGTSQQTSQSGRLVGAANEDPALNDQLAPEAIGIPASTQQGSLANAAAAAIAAVTASDAAALQRANMAATAAGLDGSSDAYSTSTVASLPFARTNTGGSDPYHSRRIGGPDDLGITTAAAAAAAAASGQPMNASSIIAAQRMLSQQQQQQQQQDEACAWSVDTQSQQSQQPTPTLFQALPIRQTLSAQTSSAFALPTGTNAATTTASSSSISQLGATMSTPLQPPSKRFRPSLSVLGSNDRGPQTNPPLSTIASSGIGGSGGDSGINISSSVGRRDSIGGSIGGLVIPDAYVQLEYQSMLGIRVAREN